MRCYHNGRRLVLPQGDCDPLLLIEIHSIFCFGNLYERGMIAMITTESLIAVISLVLTAFGLGYAIGSNNSQK